MSGRPATFDGITGRIPVGAFPGKGPPATALLIRCIDGCLPEDTLEPQLQMDGVMVVRNPGNLVPPDGSDGMAQILEQALARGARELIVCGHIGCATIARLLDQKAVLDDLALAVWLDHAEAVRLALGGVPPEERLLRALEVNVLQQLTHLRSYPAVAAGLFQGRVHLRGWLYDPAHDEVLAADPHTGRFTRRAALDPTQNRLFRQERLRARAPFPFPRRDLSSRYLA